ncbi:MAG: bifunctional oligoribonuclease/PAP phosphatase NrnA [Bacteriovoracia bacterium]
MDKTLSQAAGLIAAAKTIVISTHVMPDGDGLGAEIALYHYLKRSGKVVRVLNPDPVPERYQFLDSAGVLDVVKPKMKPPVCDLLVIVDTNEPDRLGPIWELFRKSAKNILFLDHHPILHNSEHIHENEAKVHEVIDERSSSIGELLYRLFHQAHHLLDPSSPAFRLSPEIALGLYVSIMTDTNSFRYSKTTALSHRIAADLIDYGLQPEEIYSNIFSSKTIQHLQLIGEVLSKAKEYSRGKNKGSVVYIEITKSLRQRFGAKADDTQSIVNFLLLVKNAEILVMLREEDDGKIKGSLKSKTSFKVNSIAQSFGGGGHDYAAGFLSSESLSAVRDKLLSILLKA